MQLSGPVRHRVVQLAADALPALTAEQVPAALKRVVSFAPAKRARLAATPIATALETDEAFRLRVAVEVRAAVPELARALEEGAAPAAANPVDVAAVAYVLRPDGWELLVKEADDAAPVRTDDDLAAQVRRLTKQLESARAEAKAARRKTKSQLEQLKSDNAELRHKLAESRKRVRAGEEQLSQAESARSGEATARTAAEAENRRLRSRIEELEAGVSADRRAARDERDQASARTRLLLDTLTDLAKGLARELALPAVSSAPAEWVEAVTPAAGTKQSTRARSVDDPALLQELLTLPRAHLIVDGYNVTKTAWPSTPLDQQRARLLKGLAGLSGRTSAEFTVVFDGADLVHPPPVSPPRGIRVLFSPPGVIADVTVGQLVEAEPVGRPVVVVSSDKEVAENARAEGAYAVASAALVGLLKH